MLYGVSKRAQAEPQEVEPGLTVDINPAIHGKIRVAEGIGMHYLPLTVIRDLHLLEKIYPNATVEWKTIFTTGQQRDAMLAGQLDFGTCTPEPYFQALDKGVNWKILQISSAFNSILLVKPGGPRDVKDLIKSMIGTNKKISPGPNTVQYFATQKLLLDLGLSPHALDRNWVRLPHATATQALITGDLYAYFATGNFAVDLLEKGMQRVSSLTEIYGQMHPVGVCALNSTLQRMPKISKGYANLIRVTIKWIKANPSRVDGMVRSDQTIAGFPKYIAAKAIELRTTDALYQYYGSVMAKIGAIKNAPESSAVVYAYPSKAGPRW